MMKKWLKICLVCLMMCTLIPTQNVKAEEFTKKTVTIYNNVDSAKMNLDTYIKNDEVYVQLYDLTKMLGFVVKNDQGKITLSKKGKRVTIKDGSIIYGKSKEDLSVIDQDGVIYVPLTPTINYLDARIEMLNNQLILFKPEITFSEMVSDMEDTINQGYLLVGKDGWSVVVSQIWMFLNGESSSYIESAKQERVVISLLVEDDINEFEYEESKAVNILKESTSAAVNLLDRFSKYDTSLLSLIDRNNLTQDLGGGIIENESIKNQIKHFYERNIKNAEHTILNEKYSIYKKNDAYYKEFKKYTEYYYDHSKNIDDLWTNFLSTQTVDLVADALIGKAIPFVAIGLSGIRIYSDIFDLGDQAKAILTKQEYNAIQCKILYRIVEIHGSIKKGHVLSDEEIIDYMNLVRMYYHIAAVYYKSMSEVDQKAFEGNYKAAKAIVDDIDLVPYTLYAIDDPMEQPSSITKDQIENTIQTEDWSAALKKFVKTYKFEDQLDAFNMYQSKLVLTDMNNDNIPELILCLEDGRTLDMRSSVVFSYQNDTYEKKFSFHGKPLGKYKTGNEEFFKIEETMSGSFEGFTVISELNNIKSYRMDKYDNSASLNNDKLNQKEYNDAFDKYVTQAQEIDTPKSITAFYKSLSPEHKSMIAEQLISEYNENSEKRDYEAMYSDYDTKIYLIANCDKKGLYKGTSIEDYQLVESTQDYDIYKVLDTKGSTLASYKIVKDQSLGGVEEIIDLGTK